jgi:hypothetical protein
VQKFAQVFNNGLVMSKSSVFSDTWNGVVTCQTSEKYIAAKAFAEGRPFIF